MGRGENVPDMAVFHVLDAGLHQLHTHVDRKTATDESRKNGEDKVHRADVLMVRGVKPAAHEAGRCTMISVGLSTHFCFLYANNLVGGREEDLLPGSGVRRDLRHRIVHGKFLTGGLEPGLVFRLGKGAHLDRHVGVVHAADLVALPVISLLTLGHVDPHLVGATDERINLNGKRRHEVGMHHIVAGDDQLDAGVLGNDHRVVHRQQPDLAFLEVGLVDHVAVEGDLLVRIFVVPVPLVARHLDHHVGIGRLVQVVEKPEGRYRDADKDQHGDDGPQDLDHSVVRCL